MYDTLERLHLKGLARLALLPGLLDLGSPHLLFVLTFPNSTIVFKREQDVKGWELLQFWVVVPFWRLDDKIVRRPPSRDDINVEFLEEVHYLRHATGTRGPCLLLVES